jgi:hypothetical protein
MKSTQNTLTIEDFGVIVSTETFLSARRRTTLKKLIVLCLLGVFGVAGMFAQTTAAHDVTVTVPKIQLIGLSSTATITLDVTPPVTPGDVPTGDSDATKYLRYTVINAAAATQQITVGLTGAGTLPNGTALAVAASLGTLGTPGSTGITSTAAPLITLIPSGFTGTAAGNGMLLTYTLSVSNPTLLRVNAGATVTVTYTILDT